MRILLRVATCVALLWIGVSGNPGMQVLLGEGPDPNREVPTFMAELVRDWIVRSIQIARPCSDTASIPQPSVDFVQSGDRLSVTVSAAGSSGQAVVSMSDWPAAFQTLSAFAEQRGKEMAAQLPKSEENCYGNRGDENKAAEEKVRDQHSEARSAEYSAAASRVRHGISIEK